MVCIGVLMVFFVGYAFSGNPSGAYYSTVSDNVFWFIQVTDTHVGTRGSQDSDNLLWLVTEAKETVAPEFIVVSGDLTDSTNGNLFGWPNGPYQAEWDEYKGILKQSDVNADNYFDLPGNHDAYSDQYFDYYRANSIQGQATDSTQVSWTRQFDYGKYHFLGINTADNSGDPFSFSWPWGDYAGLDTSELSFIQNELSLHNDADLTFVFGHHPVTDTGVSDDTWLYYGTEEFISLLDQNGASLYGFGHTHRSSETLFAGDAYTGYMSGAGVVYLNISSLGKSSENNFSVIAVDCNGISTRTQTMGVWPLVMITAPVDDYLGVSPDLSANPYGYAVPNAADNPIRALIFDSQTVSHVQYRIDGDDQWYAMQPVAGNSRLWEAVWDASMLAEGAHTIQVQATGSSVQSDIITVTVESDNAAPVADNQNANTDEDASVSITLTATDTDGGALTYEVVSYPSHGSLTGSAPDLLYSPDGDYSGPDSFTYKAYDGQAYSNTATVTITVAPVNDAPVAVNDAYETDQGQQLSEPAPGVLSNDSDVDDITLTASVVDSPQNGSLILNANGSFLYTPDTGYSGPDSFTYKAYDGQAYSNTAAVNITVNEVAVTDTDPPVPDPMTWATAPNAAGSTGISMTATTAADPNGVEYFFECVSGGCHDSGWQQSVSYTDTGLNPDTSYSYVVRARDLSANQNQTGDSGVASASTNPASNQPPYFISDPVNETDATVGMPYNSTLADDAEDPDSSETLTFAKISGPDWLTVASDGGLSGTPVEADEGLNQFTVQVEDESGDADTATLNIAVNAAFVEDYAVSETTVRGTVVGSLDDTIGNDGVYEELTEELKAGKFSVLEHTWAFDVAGASSIVFQVKAYRDYNTEGDDFVFAYSLDNATFTDMVVVSNDSDIGGYQLFDLPANISGTVYIRVTDTDASRNNRELDTLYVDDMCIFSSSVAGLPGAASDPAPADDASGAELDTILEWSPGANAQWHDVYFGDDQSGLEPVSSGQTETGYDPGLLNEGTTYYWRIDEGNDAGSTMGEVWSFTTSGGGSCTPTAVAVESVILSTSKGPAGTSFGQATVTILDNCGNPVAGAEVTGHFTGDFVEEPSRNLLTGVNGVVVFETSTSVKKPSFDFVVDEVIAGGLSY